MGQHNQQNYVQIYANWGVLSQGVNTWGALFQLYYEFNM